MSFIAAYPFSTLLYGFVLFISIILGYQAQRWNRSSSMAVVCMLWCTLSAIRGYSVGTDTPSYISYYLLGTESEHFEIGFIALIQLLRPLSSPQLLMFIIALLSFGPVLYRFWELRDYISLPVVIGLIYVCFLFASWNQWRFYIAASFLFFSMRYVASGEYLKFFISLTVAALFHKSAIVGLVFLCMRPLFLQDHIKKMLVGSLLVLATAALCLWLLESGFFNKYLYYYSDSNNSIGNSQFVLAALLLLAVNESIIKYRCGKADRDRVETAYLVLSIIGVVASIAITFTSFYTRPVSYLTLFCVWGLGWLWKQESDNARLLRLLICLYMGWCFFSLINTNQHHVMPYCLWF